MISSFYFILFNMFQQSVLFKNSILIFNILNFRIQGVIIGAMATQQKCSKHDKQFTKLCLAQDCKANVFLCSDCLDQGNHKHSKTDIQDIKQIKSKLKSAWQPKQSVIDGYFKKTKTFYESLRKQIGKLIDQDQKTVQSILTKVKYHHLPYEANSLAYLQFMKSQFDRLDRNTILNMVNQAQNGQLNKDLEKQKQIINFMDLQLKKVNDKVLTLKYVLLSKKLEGEMLIPKLSDQSKVADHDQFIKIYSLFNSRNMLIRSAKLVYRGSQNEFNASSFYNRCNGIRNCMAIAKTKQNKVIGGFTPLSLVYHDNQEMEEDKEYYETDATKKSFIFSITSLRSYSLKDSSKAIQYKKNWPGPCFGVDLDMGESLTSNLGNSYQCPQGVQVDSIQAKVYMLQTDKAQIKQMQIWQISF